jgi:hypothetical protein
MRSFPREGLARADSTPGSKKVATRGLEFPTNGTQTLLSTSMKKGSRRIPINESGLSFSRILHAEFESFSRLTLQRLADIRLRHILSLAFEGGIRTVYNSNLPSY